MNAKSILLTAILGVALVGKIWLVAGLEITDDPDDPIHYMEQILLHKGSCYGPGTGDVGRLFYELGIPFRLGIEAAFLLAAFAAVTALIESPTKSALALGLYLFVIFNPAIEELLSHLMSDQVWLVETLLGFSCFVFFTGTVGQVRWLYIAFASLLLGFATITRSTFVPLLGIFFLWALLALALSAVKQRRWTLNRPFVGGCFLCLYAIAFFYYATCFINAKYNHFFGLNAFDSREYQNFYLSLQSVGEPTGERYFPIDDARLKLIATAGPRSSWFVAQMARDRAFRQVSLETYGQPGIALCWFHWAVFETVDSDGDLPKDFTLFQDVENEITTAGRENRLPVRPIFPLPDARVPIVLGALPQAVRHIASLTIAQPSRYAWAWSPDEPRFENADFTRALHRHPVAPGPIREQIGLLLCAVYARVYEALLPALVLAVAAFLFAIVRRWSRVSRATSFLAQQIFLVAFVIYFLWYVLFDASGLWAVPRYVIYQNVMLPLLVAYYAREAFRLLR